ncbi:MAG TPA: hypothetical protein VD905_16825, partial [Flavobacteriales bacterium]|nr:hypothetical protein [Flavobacteriales bacterium]
MSSFFNRLLPARIFILGFCIALFADCNAQADSVISRITKKNIHDSLKLKELEAVAKKMPPYRGEVERAMGKIYALQGRLNSAEIHFLKAIEIFKKNKQAEEETQAAIDYAFNLCGIGENTKAL